jgi:hypothetical protein
MISFRKRLVSLFKYRLRKAQPTSHVIDPRHSHVRATVSASSSSSKASRQVKIAASACDSVVACRAIEAGEDRIGALHTATDAETQGASATKAALRILG